MDTDGKGVEGYGVVLVWKLGEGEIQSTKRWGEFLLLLFLQHGKPTQVCSRTKREKTYAKSSLGAGSNDPCAMESRKEKRFFWGRGLKISDLADLF